MVTVTRLRTLAMLAALATALSVMAAAPQPARGAEQLLATMTAPGSGARVQTSVSLSQGQTYRLVLGETVTLNYTSLGRREDVDAIYCFFHAGGPTFPNDDCTEQPPGPRSVVPFFLDFGGDPANRRSPIDLVGRVLPYEADHEYDLSFVAPASGPLGAYVRGFTNATGTGGIAIELYGEAPAPRRLRPPRRSRPARPRASRRSSGRRSFASSASISRRGARRPSTPSSTAAGTPSRGSAGCWARGTRSAWRRIWAARAQPA